MSYVTDITREHYLKIFDFSFISTEILGSNTNIEADQYGEKFLRKHTSIPTFDSGDREWDSEEIEYLMFDDKDIYDKNVGRLPYCLSNLLRKTADGKASV